jgi:hypothetical protein
MACETVTLIVEPKQRVIGRLPKDKFAKRDIRSLDWIVLSQSLPQMVKWINENVSSGEVWDRVSLTGMFENINKSNGRNGGFHKGRYRIQTVPRASAMEAFETQRRRYRNSAIIGYNIKAK